MKNNKVTVTETLQKDVEVTDLSRAEAEHIAERGWKDGEYILDADHFSCVEFKAKMLERERDSER